MSEIFRASVVLVLRLLSVQKNYYKITIKSVRFDLLTKVAWTCVEQVNSVLGIAHVVKSSFDSELSD